MNRDSDVNTHAPMEDPLCEPAPCEEPKQFELARWHGRCTLRLFSGVVMFGCSDGQVGARKPCAAARAPGNLALPGSVWIISPACFTEEGGPITMDDGNQLYVNFKNRVSIANGRDGEFSKVPDEPQLDRQPRCYPPTRRAPDLPPHQRVSWRRLRRLPPE